MILNSLTSAIPPLRRELVSIPSFGADSKILLQEFNAERASSFNQKQIEDKEKKGGVPIDLFYARLICVCAIDENGNFISKLEDAEEVRSKWKWSDLVLVGTEAARINGFIKEDNENLKKPTARNRQKR